mmetsp:Transcript_8969/g.13165  ORF Transcript_8969/g.13165 Transcript_8969/m.13165 type:complete len:201 (-) Transcript_8969:805-1407(-)
MKNAWFICESYRLRLVLCSDNFKFFCPSCFQILKDVLEHVVNNFKRFHVMFINCHLKIQPSKLTQVPASVGILSTKYRANLKHTVEIRRNSHLLIELRRLSKARRCSKVISSKYTSSTFTFTSNQFGSVNLNKALRIQRFAEELADCRLYPHNCIIGRSTQIQPAMIQSKFLSKTREWTVCILTFLHFLLTSCRIFDKEW